MSATMTAWVQRRYGSADVVARADVDVPEPGRGDVLVDVVATALNAGDVHIMRGEPLLVRPFFGLWAPRVAVRGMDVAGRVVTVGEGVTRFAPGDRVVGELPGGGLAEVAVAPADRLVPVPDDVSMTDAATLPVAGGTAWQALERAGVGRGDRVLVIGASGGVGTFAVQLAVARGAEVWALCGERSRALVSSIGAARTFDYRVVQPGGPELGRGFDAVLDIAGTAPLRALQDLVRDGGSVVLVSGDGGRLLGPIGRIAAASARSVGSRRSLRPLAAVVKPDVLRTLVGLVGAGRITPVIECTWPLSDARSALAHVEAGRTVGKVVVRAH